MDRWNNSRYYTNERKVPVVRLPGPVKSHRPAMLTPSKVANVEPSSVGLDLNSNAPKEFENGPRKPDSGTSFVMDARTETLGDVDASTILDDFFQVSWDFYLEDELTKLSTILQKNGMHEWAQTPALYLILRRLGQTLLISEFIAFGVSDNMLPLPKNLVETILNDINHLLVDSFLSVQESVVINNTDKYKARLQEYVASAQKDYKIPLDDVDFQQVSRILKLLGQESASKDPKLFLVLNSLEQGNLLESFQAKKLGDFHFPYPERLLKVIKVPQSARLAILERQQMVCNQHWTEEVHMNFRQDEQSWIKEVKTLGENESSTVDHIMYTGSRSHYARKRVLRTVEGLKLFANEINILKSVKHHHCIKLVTSYTDPDYMAIISQPVADMSLQALLEVSSLAEDRKQLMQTFFGCLSTALNYLHSTGIRHKDIKPQNILIHSNRVLLADFGISADRLGTTTSVLSTTPRYSAPEVEEGQSPTSSSDIFSLGCVFLEVFARLQDITSAALKQYLIENGERRSKFNSNLSAVRQWVDERMTNEHSALEEPVLNILRPCFLEMLDFDFSKRPSAKAIMSRLGTWTLPRNKAYGRCCVSQLHSHSTPVGPPTISSSLTASPATSPGHDLVSSTSNEDRGSTVSQPQSKPVTKRRSSNIGPPQIQDSANSTTYYVPFDMPEPAKHKHPNLPGEAEFYDAVSDIFNPGDRSRPSQRRQKVVFERNAIDSPSSPLPRRPKHPRTLVRNPSMERQVTQYRSRFVDSDDDNDEALASDRSFSSTKANPDLQTQPTRKNAKRQEGASGALKGFWEKLKS